MGLFDVNIKRKVKITDKKMILSYFENALKHSSSKPVVKEKEHLGLEKFKAKNAFLKYNLNMKIENSELIVEGELQNAWVFVILIVLGILFTYGIGVIIIVAFIYYQKIVSTRYLNVLIDTFEQKES